MVMRCRTEYQETFLSGKVSFVKEKSLPAKRKKSVGSGTKKTMAYQNETYRPYRETAFLFSRQSFRFSKNQDQKTVKTGQKEARLCRPCSKWKLPN
ncbi:MAG: hypothetical protein UCJ19_07640 [Oscillospiraceae bacterium]|nr:hypothetical protein [Oscillospiraceae bacterium]